MTIRIGLWLLVTWLCLPAFSFQIHSATQAPITYEGITYTHKPDGKWYASDALGESNDASFMNRVLVKLNNLENPWGLTFCTPEDVQLDPALPLAQGRYIGFGWSLLVYPSEAAGIAAANFLATERSLEEPMIQFDATVTLHSLGTNDPIYPRQSNLENTSQNCGEFSGSDNGEHRAELAMDALWHLARNSDHQSIIAVIDDAFFTEHIEIQDALWVNEDEALDGEDTDGNGFDDDIFGFNFSTCTGDVSAGIAGHGTPILGILGAQTGNGIGVSGIVSNPNGRRHAQLMLLTTFPASSTTEEGTLAAYYQAVYYAVTNGADVINASWGFNRDFPMPRDIQEIIDATSNVLIVAAVGNHPDVLPDIDFPARYDNTLAVTSGRCDALHDKTKAQFGDKVDVTAPAKVWTIDDVPLDPDTFPCVGDPRHCFGQFGATSSAAPHVTGTAAMMLAVNPFLSARNIALLIRGSAIKKGRITDGFTEARAIYEGPELHNNHTGFGLLNAMDAVGAAEGSPGIGNVQWQLLTGDNDQVDRGDEINITWESINLETGDRINIDLLDSLGNAHQVFANIPADAPGVNWFVPDDLPDNKDFVIKIQLNRVDQVYNFSKTRIVVPEQDWIAITSESSDCDYWEKTLTWDTSYSGSSSILLEVTSGSARGAVFLPNTQSRVLTYTDLDNLLRAQDPENYEPLMYFEIRLKGSPENHVVSESQGLLYGQLNVQACNPDLPTE